MERSSEGNLDKTILETSKTEENEETLRGKTWIELCVEINWEK